jgi:hypothetical protein
MRFSEHATKSTAKEKISSLLVRAGIRPSAVTAITADCSQQGARKEVTLETHAQVLQACVELRSAAQRSRTGARGPLDSPLQERPAETRSGRGRRVFLPWGFHREGGARTRGFQGRETVAGTVECAAVTKRCEAVLYATCTRAWDRERGQACTVILMSCPNSSRKRISRSREKPERRPRRRAETLG